VKTCSNLYKTHQKLQKPMYIKPIKTFLEPIPTYTSLRRIYDIR